MNSTLSTASKCNEVMAVVFVCFDRRVVRHAGWCPRAARTAVPAARSLLFCAPWGGYGAAWAAYCPRAAVRAPSASATRPVGCSRITRHETRIMAFTHGRSVCCGWARVAQPETVAGLPRPPTSYCLLCHQFPLFPTISRQKILLMSQCRCIVSRSRSASSQAPSAAESCESAQNPVSAGGCTRYAVARNSRRPASSFHRGGTQNEPMLRKENVLNCANRRTFYIALTRPPEHASELQAALFTLI